MLSFASIESLFFNVSFSQNNKCILSLSNFWGPWTLHSLEAQEVKSVPIPYTRQFTDVLCTAKFGTLYFTVPLYTPNQQPNMLTVLLNSSILFPENRRQSVPVLHQLAYRHRNFLVTTRADKFFPNRTHFQWEAMFDNDHNFFSRAATVGLAQLLRKPPVKWPNERGDLETSVTGDDGTVCYTRVEKLLILFLHRNDCCWVAF
jgi:hypothetical protein